MHLLTTHLLKLLALGLPVAVSTLLVLVGSSVRAQSQDDGVQLYNDRKYSEAVRAFEAHYTEVMADPNQAYYYALSLVGAGNTERAVQICDYIVKKYPTAPAARQAKNALDLWRANLKSSGAHAATDSGVIATGAAAAYPDRRATGLGAATPDGGPSHFLVRYTMDGPKYMVPARFNGREFKMCLDTGCARTIVPIEYIDQLGVPHPTGKPDGHYSGTGAAIWRATADIQLGPLVRRSFPIEIFDHSSWPGTPLLGNDFFAGYRRNINSSGETIEVVRADRASSQTIAKPITAPTTTSGGFVVPFERDRGGRGSPVITATINGRPVRALFDTGGNDAIWVTQEEAQRLGLAPEDGRTVYVGETRIPCQQLSVPTVQIGLMKLSDVKVMIFDKNQATWGTDTVCFGTAMLKEYDYFIDQETRTIRFLKK